MADDGWDEMFDMASGKISSESSMNDKESVPIRRKLPSKAQKNKKSDGKRKRPREDEAFAEMLASRMSVKKPTWPSWLSLGPSYGSHCSGWQDSEGDSSKGSCQQCKRSGLCHRAKLSDQDRSWAMAMFVIVRNVRCCAIDIFNNIERGDLSLSRLLEADLILSLIKSAQSTLPPGEVSLLESKCSQLVQSVQHFDRQATREKKRAAKTQFSFFEAKVRVIMACDDVFYRLYYLQITKSVPENALFIPHPTDYFLVPYLSWDVNEGNIYKDKFLKKLRKRLKECDEEGSTWSSLLCRYGLNRASESRGYDHPLSQLHCNRLLETLDLFQKSGWASKQQRKSSLQFSMPKDNDLSCHETPAPLILMEWRDSCRDLLCNLYAYATLVPETIQRIHTTFEAHGIQGGVVELGSGTGYIAKLFAVAELNMLVGWDVRPTEHSSGSKATNEYHGSTPEFFQVQKGDIGALQSFFRSSGHKAKQVALLLSYAPPQSLMAYNALKTYISAGGQCMVHIGEFRGLTGSAEFESLLMNNFRCVDRSPCLSWGTDASETSIWIRLDRDEKEEDATPVEQPSPSRLLLPCSNCGQREAAKRCTLARFLVYCGGACFRAHEEERSVDLALNMISDNDITLAFENENHFSTISSLNTRALRHN